MNKECQLSAVEKSQSLQSQADSMIGVIERAAMDPACDVDKMERLFEMQLRVMARNAELSFNNALANVQASMGRISADSNNPQTRSRYASYAQLDKAIRPIYTRQGLSLSFGTGDIADPEKVRIICYVSHRDGHTREYHADIDASGKGAKGGDVMTKTHAAGSAMTYGMRYLLKMIFNVAIGEDDDDGNAAGAVVERISEEQATDIKALIEEIGADERQYLRFLKVGSLEDIPLSQYAYAVRALEEKRKRQ